MAGSPETFGVKTFLTSPKRDESGGIIFAETTEIDKPAMRGILYGDDPNLFITIYPPSKTMLNAVLSRLRRLGKPRTNPVPPAAGAPAGNAPH